MSILQPLSVYIEKLLYEDLGCAGKKEERKQARRKERKCVHTGLVRGPQ
jgi:hypothetical protein